MHNHMNDESVSNSSTISSSPPNELEIFQNCYQEKLLEFMLKLHANSGFESNTYFVKFFDIEFKTNNIRNAMLFCFKIHKTFCLSFPFESLNFWFFVENFFFDVKSISNVALSVRRLLYNFNKHN